MSFTANESPNARSNHQCKTVDPQTFYGCVKEIALSEAPKTVTPIQLCRRFKRLFGPSTIWKSFKKQQEALDFVATTINCDLMPFVYQTLNGDRFFLVTHPVTFWFVDEQRADDQRHTYEIIQEFKPCKLYFDLEFERGFHLERDGYKMVKDFIYLVCQALKNKYNVNCDAEDILNLDSSSPQKFSCHLIFPNVIFCNNYHAGLFVKRLCYEIRFYKKKLDACLLRDIDIPHIKMDDFFVNDSKNIQKLFCDEGVYTKNRHFRLYKSSKYEKNVPLKVSEINTFKIQGNDATSKEEFTFLCSLVTYCNSNLPILTYDEDPPLTAECRKLQMLVTERETKKQYSSPFREIDECIEDIIHPGKIYRSTCFENKNIVYDIIGNRYCRNIGRQHKSNNVMYIVDLQDFMYYQKCYDPECAGFKSEKFKLPLDPCGIQRKLFKTVKTYAEESSAENEALDKLLITAAEQCESSLQDCHTKKIDFPDDLSEDYLIQVTINCENRKEFE